MGLDLSFVTSQHRVCPAVHDHRWPRWRSGPRFYPVCFRKNVTMSCQISIYSNFLCRQVFLFYAQTAPWNDIYVPVTPWFSTTGDEPNSLRKCAFGAKMYKINENTTFRKKHAYIVEDEIEIPELNVTRPTAYFKGRNQTPARTYQHPLTPWG